MNAFKTILGAMALCLTAGGAGAATVAYDVPVTAGNQAYPGVMGMFFDVNSAVNVLSLGVFDDLANGISAGTTLTVELWSRAGTSGTAILASDSFTSASQGTLLNGSRFKALMAPLLLAAGQYAIVSYGYNGSDPNGNGYGGPVSWTTNTGGGLLSFVGSGAFAGTPGASIGDITDSGPYNRYAAGTFAFAAVPLPSAALMLVSGVGGLAALRRRKARAA